MIRRILDSNRSLTFLFILISVTICHFIPRFFVILLLLCHFYCLINQLINLFLFLFFFVLFYSIYVYRKKEYIIIYTSARKIYMRCYFKFFFCCATTRNCAMITLWFKDCYVALYHILNYMHKILFLSF